MQVESDSERLFFALWPDPTVQQEAFARVQASLRRGGGRPVRPENFHLTLAFLGEVSSERRACVERAADRVRAPGFELVLERIGYWRRARVVWLGPAERAPEPPALVPALWSALEECGYSAETRPFFPHLTLVRKANRGPRGESVDPVVWPVTDFVLVASRMASEGVRYEVLRRWPLTDAD